MPTNLRIYGSFSTIRRPFYNIHTTLIAVLGLPMRIIQLTSTERLFSPKFETGNAAAYFEGERLLKVRFRSLVVSVKMLKRSVSMLILFKKMNACTTVCDNRAKEGHHHCGDILYSALVLRHTIF